MKTPALLSRLPRPLRWGLYAIGGYVALKVIATVLALTIALAWTLLLAMVVVAVVAALLRR